MELLPPSLAHLFSGFAWAKPSALASRETNQRCEGDIKAKPTLCQQLINLISTKSNTGYAKFACVIFSSTYGLTKNDTDEPSYNWVSY